MVQLLNYWFTDFSLCLDCEEENTLKPLVIEHWSSPWYDWLKANTDASFTRNKVVLVMVSGDSTKR